MVWNIILCNVALVENLLSLQFQVSTEVGNIVAAPISTICNISVHGEKYTYPFKRFLTSTSNGSSCLQVLKYWSSFQTSPSTQQQTYFSQQLFSFTSALRGAVSPLHSSPPPSTVAAGPSSHCVRGQTGWQTKLQPGVCCILRHVHIKICFLMQFSVDSLQ